jgi:hypothetical protein
VWAMLDSAAGSQCTRAPTNAAGATSRGNWVKHETRIRMYGLKRASRSQRQAPFSLKSPIRRRARCDHRSANYLN